MPHTLYITPLSPFARKAMILNRIGGLGVDEVAVQHDARTGYRSDINPLGKIPALVLDDGKLIADSPVICEWLDGRGPGLLAKASDPIGARTLHAIGDGLSSAVYDYRYETVRAKALHWSEMIERKSVAIQATLEWLEANVGQLSIGELCWGGLAVGCALDYCAFRYDGARPDTPELEAWYAATCRGPAWTETNAYGAA